MLLHSATLHILVRAAEDALDFTMRDAQSKTTMADCIQANYEAWERNATVSSVQMNIVSKQLAQLGFHF